MSNYRFDTYQTTTGEWSVLDTETKEATPPRSLIDADNLCELLNRNPDFAILYLWLEQAPDPWDSDGPEDSDFPETLRPEIGEARQLATALAMLGMNDAANTILKLIILVEDN